MATTNKNQNKNSSRTRTQSSGKGKRKKKNSSDDTMKFLLVLVIAGIAIALIFFSRKDDDPAANTNTGAPTPTMAEEQPGNSQEEVTPAPTIAPTTEPNQGNTENTPVPTEALQPTATPEPTATTAPQPTETPAPTGTPTPTPTPLPVLSVTEAEKVVADKVDTTVYNVQLFDEDLVVGNGSYYQFGAIKNQEIISPFLVVSKQDGSLHFYDSTEGTVFDFTKFPLYAEATPTPVPTEAPSKELTAKEAYEVLCTYSKESLRISKEVKEYDAEYGEELTLIDGVNCYRINLSEFSNGKVRNRGEFYVSVDGTRCYYIDSDTNEFIKAVK